MSVGSIGKKIVVISAVAVAAAVAVVLVVCLCFCRHDYKQEILVAATCTNTGVAKTVCAKCGDVKSAEEIPALGHNAVKIDAVLPTHAASGSTESEKCSRCDAVIKAAEIVKPLRYIVLCLESSSEFLGSDGNVGFEIAGLKAIFVGLSSGGAAEFEEFDDIVDSIDERKRNGGYAVFEASVGEELTAKASVDFVGDYGLEWVMEDSVSGKTDDLTFTVPENDLVIFVALKKIYTIKVSADPESRVPDIESDGKIDGGFYEGSLVTLTAKEVDGYVFFGWFKNDELYGDRSAVISDVVTGNAEYRAIYRKLSKLSVSVAEGEGSVSISDDYWTGGKSTVIEKAEEQTTYYLHAVPSDGYEFDGWYDGETRLSGETVFQYLAGDCDKTIAAKFRPKK